MTPKFKIGQKVYFVEMEVHFFNPNTYKIVELEISDIQYSVAGVAYGVDGYHFFYTDDADRILYATKEEAEKAMFDTIQNLKQSESKS